MYSRLCQNSIKKTTNMWHLEAYLCKSVISIAKAEVMVCGDLIILQFFQQTISCPPQINLHRFPVYTSDFVKVIVFESNSEKTMNYVLYITGEAIRCEKSVFICTA